MWAGGFDFDTVRGDGKSARPATGNDVVVKRLNLQMSTDASAKDEVFGQPPARKIPVDPFL